jgi:hypothetical protein
MTGPPIQSNYPSTGGGSQLAGYWLDIGRLAYPPAGYPPLNPGDEPAI